jgi:hypothetical protein
MARSLRSIGALVDVGNLVLWKCTTLICMLGQQVLAALEKHGCPLEKHGCPLEKHGCPLEKHGCPSRSMAVPREAWLSLEKHGCISKSMDIPPEA